MNTFKAAVAAIMLAVSFAGSVAAGPREDAAAANLRSCMQRAVVSLDDKVSDVRSWVRWSAIVTRRRMPSPRASNFVVTLESR
jgi:hypothetical protein